MEPPVFVLPLSCWFQNRFGFQDWTYFSGRRKLLTPLNHKGPPLWWKIRIFFRKPFLIAQKKCPDALNATQKTPALYNVPFLNKSRKTDKNAHFFKNAIFWRFFSIYSGTVHCRELGSFVLYSVHQDASFELSKSTFRQFFKIFITRGDPYDFGWLKVYVYH